MRQLSDATGTLTLGQFYEPYGDILSSAGAGSTSYGFTGEWTDGTGLVYLRARYMNTGVGRFMSRDVWEGNYRLPLTLNKWGYVEANPINYTDPSGFTTFRAPLAFFSTGPDYKGAPKETS